MRWTRPKGRRGTALKGKEKKRRVVKKRTQTKKTQRSTLHISFSNPPPPTLASLLALARQRVARRRPALVAPARVRVRLQVRPQHLDVGPRHELGEALRDRARHQLAHREHAVRELRRRHKVVGSGRLVLGVDRALPEELGDEGVALERRVAVCDVVVEPLLDEEVGVAELWKFLRFCCFGGRGRGRKGVERERREKVRERVFFLLTPFSFSCPIPFSFLFLLPGPGRAGPSGP